MILFRRGSRAAHEPLPAPVLLLGVLGGAALLLPFLGLGTRVPWTRLATVLSSEAAHQALRLSLRTCLVSTVFSLLLGVPLALLLARQWPGVRAARVLAVLPMTVPPVVAGIALLSTLGKRGALGPFLEATGLQVAFTTAAVVIAQVFVSMPFLVVTLEAALRSRDRQTESVARTLGAGPWTVLLRVTLPLVAPALARGTGLALGRSLGEFGATIAFAGSKAGVTRTMPLAIYLERENDSATSLALAVVLIALSLLVVGTTSLPWSWLLTSWRASGLPPAAPAPSTPAAPTSSAPAPDEPLGRSVHVSFHSPGRGVSLTLDVPAGRTLALVGENGSGKSTVCGVVAGLLDAVDGEVRVGDRLVDGPATFVPAGHREVALLSQSPGVLARMSVLDNVAFGPRCQGLSRREARERALAELRAVGAEHLAQRPGSALSGGQAARVALARAMATSPRVLVLDEPTAALDVTSRAEVRSVIARRTQEGLTVLLVTHDVLDVVTLADEVAVLEEGRLAEHAATAQVLAAPTSRFGARMSGLTVLPGWIEGSPAAPVLRLSSGQRVSARPDHRDLLPHGPGAALIPPDAVALYRDRQDDAGTTTHGSPRNALPGTVERVELSGGLVTVHVQVEGGHLLTATLTAGAVTELGLRAGAPVTCVIKAVQVRLIARRQDAHDPLRQEPA